MQGGGWGGGGGVGGGGGGGGSKTEMIASVSKKQIKIHKDVKYERFLNVGKAKQCAHFRHDYGAEACQHDPLTVTT